MCTWGELAGRLLWGSAAPPAGRTCVAASWVYQNGEVPRGNKRPRRNR